MNLTHIPNVISFAEILTVINILQYKNIENVIVINCDKRFDIIAAHKIFAQNKVRTHFEIISDDFTKNLNKIYYFKFGVILYTRCVNWENVFDIIDVKEAFKSPFVWLIITDDVYATSNVLSKYPIEIDSDVTICRRKEIEEKVELYEIFNTGFNNNGMFHMQYEEIQNYTKNNPFLRRIDMSGVRLKFTIVVTRDLFNETIEEFLINSAKDGIDSLHKLKFFIILQYLQDMYNHT